MKNFIVYDSKGNILRAGSCQDGDILLQAGNGEFVMEGIADDATQMIVDGEIVSKPELTDSEKNTAALQELRETRDSALEWCDWTQVTDSPLTADQRTEWQLYRQQLRDLPAAQPANLTSIDDVSWPTVPGS